VTTVAPMRSHCLGPKTGGRVTAAVDPSNGETGRQVLLLGGFGVVEDGQSHELPPASQRLVGFLALRNRPVLRLHVAATLWTNTSEPKASANLRTTLWRLRHFDPPLVDVTSRHARLADGVGVDARDSVALAHSLIDEPANHLHRARDVLDEPDELLPDWYDDWVLMEREHFRQLRFHALESLCHELSEAGRFGQAVEVGQAAIRAEPLRESAHRALIEAYVAEGNVSEAVRQVERFRRLLKRQLGIEPSARLMQSAQRLGVG
jgi:DNA-binding SARP family transcriptional activator